MGKPVTRNWIFWMIDGGDAIDRGARRQADFRSFGGVDQPPM